MQRLLFALALIGILATSLFFVCLHRYQALASQHPISACIDIPATPNYLSSGSEQDAVAAINNARLLEHLPPLSLPDDFYQLDSVQQQFMLVNLERTDRGLRPLHMDATLSQMALAYSKQLRDLGFFSHTSPIGGTFGERINSNPATANHYRLAAENLAGNPVAGAGPIYEYMYDDASDACGHRQTILNPQLTLIGIGSAAGGRYGNISAQEFITPAPWNPYVGGTPDTISPQITIEEYHGIHEMQFHYQALTEDNVGVVRITWFLDALGNQLGTGSLLTLDAQHLSAGLHTLFAYAVDGEQNYGMAAYVFVV